MPADFDNIEELITDDSFCNYCFNRNEEDTLFWETWMELNPLEKPRVMAARAIVMAMRDAIFQQELAHRKKLRMIRVLQLATICMVVICGLFFTWHQVLKYRPGEELVVRKEVRQHVVKEYHSAYGKKEKIVLPDSTIVELNAGSKLLVGTGFNSGSRDVYLEGEALFDVRHRTELPFTVQTSGYDVQVLGTLFNVKAYPFDNNSETTLIRGKVKLLKRDGSQLTLLPLQKAVFENDKLERSGPDITPPDTYAIQMVLPVKQDSLGIIAEISWTTNQLLIRNESFNDFKIRLERWFDVEIEIQGSEIGQQSFTGHFHDEPVEKVLDALQFSYPFNYQRTGNKIIITE